MGVLTWTAEQFGTDVDICDGQHKELFRLFNALYDKVNGGDQSGVGEKLDLFRSFVAEHFSTEERLMREMGYQYYDGHKAQHDAFQSNVAGVSADSLTSDIIGGWAAWWLSHIPSSDRPYGPVLREINWE